MFGADEPPPDEWPRGLLLAFGLHVFQFFLVPLTNGHSLLFVGVSQLLYVLPAIASFWRDRENGLVKGLIIGASITFLLNASCLAVFSKAWPP